MDALGINDVSQELDGCFGEFTLLVSCDTCFPEVLEQFPEALEHFPEVLEHFPKMLVVRRLVWCMDEDVIHVAYDPITGLLGSVTLSAGKFHWQS